MKKAKKKSVGAPRLRRTRSPMVLSSAPRKSSRRSDHGSKRQQAAYAKTHMLLCFDWLGPGEDHYLTAECAARALSRDGLKIVRYRK